MKLKRVPLGFWGRNVRVRPAFMVLGVVVFALSVIAWSAFLFPNVSIMASYSFELFRAWPDSPVGSGDLVSLASFAMAAATTNDAVILPNDAADRAISPQDDLARIAYHDALTGLRNRRGLDEDFNAILSDGFHLKTRAALILLDLDRFKFINDTLGHDAGDHILIELAKRIQTITNEHQICYRLGGDEFVILWVGAPSYAKLEEFCKSIKTALREPYSLENSTVESGGSIGVTWQNPDDHSLGALLKRADLALYKAKGDAGTAHRFYCGQMEIESGRKRDIHAQLRDMILTSKFDLKYQPIAKATNLKQDYCYVKASTSAEAQDWLLSQEYTDELYASGLNVQFERAILEQVVSAMKGANSRRSLVLDMSVDQLIDRTFTSYITDLLQDSDIEASRLLFVFDQFGHSEKHDLVQKSLKELMTIGIAIGSRNLDMQASTLSGSPRAKRRYLVLSRHWSSKIASDDNALQLLNNLVRLAHGIGQSVILDGIDYPAQLKVLQDLPSMMIRGEMAGRVRDHI